MADIKISQLGAALAVNDTDVVPIVSGGNTLKATAAQLKEHAIGDTDISDLGDGTPTGAIAALNTELGTTKQALTNVESDIAPIEDGTNYSTSYTKGRQFIRGGLLYKVTASSVNSSTAINTTSGGNATLADSVTEQIFTDFTSATSDGNTLRISKTGKIAFLDLYFNGATNASGAISITIPTGFRPKDVISLYTSGCNVSGGVGSAAASLIQIYTDGRISTSNQSGFYGHISVTYEIA